MQVFLPPVNDPQEPALAHLRPSVRPGIEVCERVGQERGDGLFGRRRAGEGAGHVVAPELQAQGTDCGGGDGVGDAKGFEGSEGEVGGLSGEGMKARRVREGESIFLFTARGEWVLGWEMALGGSLTALDLRSKFWRIGLHRWPGRACWWRRSAGGVVTLLVCRIVAMVSS